VQSQKQNVQFKLKLGLHILFFGLHKIGWTAPLEYALRAVKGFFKPLRACVVAIGRHFYCSY